MTKDLVLIAQDLDVEKHQDRFGPSTLRTGFPENDLVRHLVGTNGERPSSVPIPAVVLGASELGKIS